METSPLVQDAPPRPGLRSTVQKLARAASFLRALINAVPSAVFVVEEDVRIYEYNRAASKLVGQKPEQVLHSKAGDVLNCVHSRETAGGCGRSGACQTCVVRNSSTAALAGNSVVRQKTTLELLAAEGVVRALTVLVTASPFEHEGTKLVLLLIEDMGDLIELGTPLPMCAQCKALQS